MQVSIENIGTLIAFLLPGLVAVAGVSGFSPIVRRWLGVERDDGPTIGAALLLGLAAFGAGLLLDAVRIQTVDEIHHHTGIAPPDRPADPRASGAGGGGVAVPPRADVACRDHQGHTCGAEGHKPLCTGKE